LLETLAALVEPSALGVTARESPWVYPVANLAHLLGLVLLIGGIGLVDLRIAGWFRALPLDALSRLLTPLAIGGLVLLACSGVFLFAADATALARSSRFQLKLVLIVLALLNALAFRALWRGGEPGLLLRAMAAGSLILWLTVAALGRLIAYA
jgi:hypothetical protein